MRAFIAINVPEFLKDALAELQSVLRVGKPVSPEQFHLTLVFMDEQPDELIEEAHFALQQLEVPKFEVKLQGLDTFGGKAPSILYVGIEKNEELDRLQEKVIGVLRSAGVHLDRKRFRPHVTIARFGRRLSKADIDRLRGFMAGYANFGPVSFKVESFSLFRSTLGHKGAVHDELAQYIMT
ncbi:2'-5' RNA ligase [Rhodobacterales bacterium 52_120_T64]|nr:2'-5' RNA ligase [Rhodobacterales bacterium 52_120_T64]